VFAGSGSGGVGSYYSQSSSLQSWFGRQPNRGTTYPRLDGRPGWGAVWFIRKCIKSGETRVIVAVVEASHCSPKISSETAIIW
jgi:hypothetical protein